MICESTRISNSCTIHDTVRLSFITIQVTDISKGTGSAYVIKIEPHDNGPLFSELSFYQRKAKPEHGKLCL